MELARAAVRSAEYAVLDRCSAAAEEEALPAADRARVMADAGAGLMMRGNRDAAAATSHAGSNE